jgi:vacuolar-type H+-ATPase subunit H
MEIEIKRIQSELLEIEVIKEITQTEQSLEPIIEEIKNNDEQILKAIKEFNKILKK